MSNDLMLDVGLANELKMAFRRHGYTSEEIKRLTEGETLGQVRKVLLGQMEIRLKPFPIWKTVYLGTGFETADDFRTALEQEGMEISDQVNGILGNPAFMVSCRVCEVDLVDVSVADLGFKNGACCRDIHARALELGLHLCPAEVGPRLCLQYSNQMENELFVIGMKPIADLDGYPSVFTVWYENDWIFLDGENFGGDVFWDANCRFVFVRPRE